ncbi:hypothetical protein SAMN06269185_0658 [Natronoarchaeum philippinense]|uniref:Uncharacterized protein n=1 Tax=Natronoarchaeum philippinense TaxID=558529 RepID=A0A285N783_NATPI|nr:hypothetical protein [Natronoarchaeum philippinense]SNZ04727.1 hypothetical protein SAMN06269185_0658 [Natronoarchaeum philippinense]
MVLKRLLGSKKSRAFTALSALAQAGREFSRGDTKLGAVFVGLAALAYRSTAASVAAQGLIWWYRRRGGAAEHSV